MALSLFLSWANWWGRRSQERTKVRHGRATIPTAPRRMHSKRAHAAYPLLRAAIIGDVKEFRSLLSKDGPAQLIVTRDQFGNTALHSASRFGHEGIVKHIVEKTDCGDELLLARNSNGDTAAHEAIRNDHVKIALRLIQKQPTAAEVLSNKRESLLYLAAERSHTKIVRRLLEVDGSRHDGPKGRTALHAAVRTRNPPALSIVLFLFENRLALWAALSIVELLLQKRPELNWKADDRGDIPLHHAAYMGNERMALWLLISDFSTVYHPNNDGNTPIHVAAMAGHLPVMGLLLRACPEGGAIVNRRGRNALHLAIQCQRTEVVGYILGDRRLQGLVYEKDKDGNGPLHLAALHWNLQILRLLLKSGVDKLATNNKDQTALDVFLENEEKNPTILWLRKAVAHIPKAGDNEEAEQEKELKDSLAVDQKIKAAIQSNKDDRSLVQMLTTFIAAITFAAAFAVPGGYRSESSENAHQSGLPILQGDVAFKVFIASDVITISSSLAALFLSFYVIRAYIDIHSFIHYWAAIIWLLTGAFVGMTTAFAAGMYAILAPNAPWFAISLCAICGSLPFTTYVWARSEDLKLAFRTWMIHRSWSIKRATTQQT